MCSEWQKTTLGEVFDVRDGTHDSPKYQDEGYPLITSKNLKNGSLSFEKVNFISKVDFEKINVRSEVHKGDILFAMIGTIGNPVLIIEEPVFAIKNVALFKVPKTQSGKFLKYYLESSFVTEKMSKEAKGATQKFVGLGYLRKFPISLPPIPEQQRIVAILDQAFADIEKARANAEKNLKNARELFDSYLNQVFSQRGEGWVETSLASIAENLDSRRVPITKSKRTKGEYPYYGASGIVDYVSDFIFDEDLLLISEDGANLLARTYPIAFSASGKYWVNNHAHVLRFKNGNQQKFIEYYLNSISLVPYISGMAQPKLNQKSLNNIPVPMADSVIVNEIVKKLNVLSNDIDELEVTYKNKLASLEELKKSLLQKAFSGELTKTEGHAA